MSHMTRSDTYNVWRIAHDKGLLFTLNRDEKNLTKTRDEKFFVKKMKKVCEMKISNNVWRIEMEKFVKMKIPKSSKSVTSKN